MLFASYFQPAPLEVRPFGQVWSQAFRPGLRNPRSYFGLYPFRWQSGWQEAFSALLADASAYYLTEAITNAKRAADQLEALARHRALSREQAHRLRSAAAAAGMAAAVGERMLWELRAG